MRYLILLSIILTLILVNLTLQPKTDDFRVELQNEELKSRIGHLELALRDSEKRNETRFREGTIRVIYAGCLTRSQGNIFYCGEFAGAAYREQVWKLEAAGWDIMWEIINEQKNQRKNEQEKRSTTLAIPQ